MIKAYETVSAERRNGVLVINESVTKLDDTYKVRRTVDVPQSLVSKIAKKIKDETGKDAKEQWSDSDIAEAIVAYVIDTFLNEESIPSGAVTGISDEDEDEDGQPTQPVQVQGQPVQGQPVQTGQTVQGQGQPVSVQASTPLTLKENENADLPPVTIQQP